MEKILREKLNELNKEYSLNTTLIITNDTSGEYSILEDKITVGLKNKNPLWILCHEYKHSIQYRHKNYIAMKRLLSIKRKINLTQINLLLLIILGIEASFNYLQNFYSLEIIICSILLIGMFLMRMESQSSKLSHHLEYRADLFASRKTGQLPYKEDIEQKHDSISHPSTEKRLDYLKKHIT